MYSLDMNFLVPNDKIKFEKMAFLMRPSDDYNGKKILMSCNSLANDSQTKVEVLEGVEYERVDPFPHLPNLIDGDLFNKLTDEEQSAYCLIEGEYLFEFLNSSSLGEANDETPDWSKLSD